jgi:hypothetical protein
MFSRDLLNGATRIAFEMFKFLHYFYVFFFNEVFEFVFLLSSWEVDAWLTDTPAVSNS